MRHSKATAEALTHFFSGNLLLYHCGVVPSIPHPCSGATKSGYARLLYDVHLTHNQRYYTLDSLHERSQRRQT